MQKYLFFVTILAFMSVAPSAHAQYGYGYGYGIPHCHGVDHLGRDGMCHHSEVSVVTRSQRTFRTFRTSHAVRFGGVVATQHISRPSPTEAPRRAEVQAKCEEQAAKRRALGIPSEATWTGPRTCTAPGGIVEEGAI